MNEYQIKHDKYKQKDKRWFKELTALGTVLIIFGFFLCVVGLSTLTKISNAGSISLLIFTIFAWIVGVFAWGLIGYWNVKEFFYFIILFWSFVW